jgi:hypothetical protein
MTSYDFRLLSHQQQVEKLYHDGVFIGKQMNGSRTIVLYQLDSFYVEIIYTKYRYFINSLRIYRSISKLDPYLDEINVGELIKC